MELVRPPGGGQEVDLVPPCSSLGRLGEAVVSASAAGPEAVQQEGKMDREAEQPGTASACHHSHSDDAATCRRGCMCPQPQMPQAEGGAPARAAPVAGEPEGHR